MKTYTKKNGEIVTYDQNKYNQKYYEQNKQKIAEQVYTCESCNKEGIKQRNKYNHEKTLKHQLYVEIKNKD